MRARKICSHAACPNLEPCADHPTGPWAGSARDKGQRISGSRRQKRARYILNRDDTICHVCGNPGANEADHIVPLAHGGADDVSNLRAIHGGPGSCHERKTQSEAKGAG